MQIVLDTNVLVSGLLSAAGPPGRIVEAALAGHLELVFDEAIRREYEEYSGDRSWRCHRVA